MPCRTVSEWRNVWRASHQRGMWPRVSALQKPLRGMVKEAHFSCTLSHPDRVIAKAISTAVTGLFLEFNTFGGCNLFSVSSHRLNTVLSSVMPLKKERISSMGSTLKPAPSCFSTNSNWPFCRCSGEMKSPLEPASTLKSPR